MDFIDFLAKATGLSSFSFIAILFVASLGFLFAMREFFYWYLRIHKLSESIKEMSLELRELRREVTKIKTLKVTEAPLVSQAHEPEQKTKTDRFHLSH